MPPRGAEPEQTVVWLGNRKAIEEFDDPEDAQAALDEERAPRRLRVPLPGKRCTTFRIATGLPLMQAAYDLTLPQRGGWAAHSDADAPAWVASTDPALAQVLAAHWGCEIRDPEPDDGTEQA